MIDRITILGGSSVYIPEFVLSAISHNINVKEIVLFANPTRKLDIVARFSQRLVDKSGFPCKIIPCGDLRQAVTGAKYVINHIRVGGMQARMRDEMLPRQYDMIGDESLGPGGFANAMRSLPVVFDYAQQIEEVNPRAILINLTNPMGILVEGLLKYSNLQTIGVCDLPSTTLKRIASVLQQDPENLRADYIGLYHFGWFQDIKVDNRSRMSQLLELLENREEEELDYDLIELFRMIPTPATSLFFHRTELLRKQQACPRFRSEALYEAEKQILSLYENEHLNEIPDLTRQRNAVWYEDIILPLMQALENDHERELILCLRNDGNIRDLPEDCSVELPASVSRRGIRPKKAGNLPRFLKGFFVAAKESDRLTVEAVRHRSYEYALQALVINPFVPSITAAKRYLERIIKEDKLELH